MTWLYVLLVVLMIYVLWQWLDKRLLEKRVKALRAGLVDLTNRNLNLVQDLIELRKFTDSRQRALDLEIKKNAQVQREHTELKAQYETLESKLTVAHLLGGVQTVGEEKQAPPKTFVGELVDAQIEYKALSENEVNQIYHNSLPQVVSGESHVQ